jgi:hypothetical protein
MVASHLDDVVSDSSSDHGDGVQTLVIFDWDDTLFPTSWLQRQGFFKADAVPSMQQTAQLQKLADVVERTLRTALLFGKVVVVTNAEKGWVEVCCSKLMPSLAQVLSEVDIVSARSAYERHSQNPSEWKRLAFAHEVEQLHIQSNEQLNVVSVGDSLYEQHAVMAVCENVQNCFAKSLKFMDKPSIEELVDQHDFFESCFLDVLEHNGDLDVEIGA